MRAKGSAMALPGSGGSRSWRDASPLEQLPCLFETHPWSVVPLGPVVSLVLARSPTTVASAANYWPPAMRLWTGSVTLLSRWQNLIETLESSPPGRIPQVSTEGPPAPTEQAAVRNVQDNTRRYVMYGQLFWAGTASACALTRVREVDGQEPARALFSQIPFSLPAVFPGNRAKLHLCKIGGSPKEFLFEGS